MPDNLTIVERALELARSGDCASVNEIRQQLRREGHDAIHAELQGSAINRQLVELIRSFAPRERLPIHQR